MTQPEVSVAVPADRDRVVETVVTAFARDPAFRYFFPDDGTYREHAAIFAGHMFDRRVHLGTIWITDGGASVAMWDPPAGDPPAQGQPAGAGQATQWPGPAGRCARTAGHL